MRKVEKKRKKGFAPTAVMGKMSEREKSDFWCRLFFLTPRALKQLVISLIIFSLFQQLNLCSSNR